MNCKNQPMKQRAGKFREIPAKTTWIIVFWTILIVGCTTLASPSAPPLGERTLYLSVKRPGFAYYGYCQDEVMLSDKCKVWNSDYYDLNDTAMVQRLIDLGYRLVPKNRKY